MKNWESAEHTHKTCMNGFQKCLKFQNILDILSPTFIGGFRGPDITQSCAKLEDL
jgi:hypothetical protein